MSHSQQQHHYNYIIQYVGQSMASIYKFSSRFTLAPQVLYIGFRLRPPYCTIYITYIYIILYEEREELMKKMKKVVTGFDEVEEERNMDWILDLACRNESRT